MKAIGSKEVDEKLERLLNHQFPVEGLEFRKLAELCAVGEREGWLLQRSSGGIKFGRAIKPGGGAGRFSVDVVRMSNVVGPHHVHPAGEIGAVIPLSGAPRFDGKVPGWYVYQAGSEHAPTLSDGDAYVLYLLPEGAIEFTGREICRKS